MQKGAAGPKSSSCHSLVGPQEELVLLAQLQGCHQVQGHGFQGVGIPRYQLCGQRIAGLHDSQAV